MRERMDGCTKATIIWLALVLSMAINISVCTMQRKAGIQKAFFWANQFKLSCGSEKFSSLSLRSVRSDGAIAVLFNPNDVKFWEIRLDFKRRMRATDLLLYFTGRRAFKSYQILWSLPVMDYDWISAGWAEGIKGQLLCASLRLSRISMQVCMWHYSKNRCRMGSFTAWSDCPKHFLRSLSHHLALFHTKTDKRWLRIRKFWKV